MGLYSTFTTSQYYDTPVVKKENKPSTTKSSEYKKPHQMPKDYGLTPQKRRSLYAEAKEAATTHSEFSNIDFNNLYRVGQMLMIQAPNGTVRTKKGRIVEIVDKDLMYVAMEDTYRDVNNFWLVDFVTPKDKITKL